MIIGPGCRTYLSQTVPGGAPTPRNGGDLGDIVLASGKTLLTLAEMQSICGGVHPFEYASLPANGDPLDGGGKSVYATKNEDGTFEKAQNSHIFYSYRIDCICTWNRKFNIKSIYGFTNSCCFIF